MKRVNLELSDELYAQVRAAAGDVPVNRWLRRAVEQALGHSGMASDSGSAAARRPDPAPAERLYKGTITELRSSSQAKRNVKPIPKGKR